jgi:hypothetical protein
MIYAAMVSRRFFWSPRGNQMTYGRTTSPRHPTSPGAGSAKREHYTGDQIYTGIRDVLETQV